MRIFKTWRIDVGVLARWSRLLSAIGFAVILLLSLMPVAQAQTGNVCLNPGAASKGGFELESARICAGTPVKVASVAPNVANPGYVFQYDGNGIPNSALNQPTFTYTKPGSYTILQVGSGGGQSTGTIACKTVEVLPLNQVQFTVRACTGRRAIIDAVLDDNTKRYDVYVINWGDGTVEQMFRDKFIAEPPSHTYPNSARIDYPVSISGRYNGLGCQSLPTTVPVTLEPTAGQPFITQLTSIGDTVISLQYQSSVSNVQLYQKQADGGERLVQTGNGTGTFAIPTNTRQQQCFQLVSQDACGGGGTRSEVVCSIVMSASATNGQNDVSWQPYAGDGDFRSYRVLRNNGPVGGLITNKTRTTYADNDKIECGTQYCYSLEAKAGRATILSAPVCVTGISGETPGEFKSVLVSVEDGSPRLVAALPATGATTNYTLSVGRSNSPSGPFESIGTIANKNVYEDKNVNSSAQSYCYQVTYQSNCGLSSPPSKPACTVHLSSTAGEAIGWTTGSPFAPGAAASYTLEIIDSVNNTKQTREVQLDSVFTPDPNEFNSQTQRYRIIANASDGVISYSNFYTLQREAKIVVPDAFTPDGDRGNTNEVFIPKGLFWDQFEMNIYDRWGTVIYSTTDRSKGWDGTIGGQPAQAGQYMYRIQVRDSTGQKTVKTGAVLLLRKPGQ